MRFEPPATRRSLVVLAVATALAWAAAGSALAGDFQQDLERIDRALQTNPNHAAKRALYTCQDRRNRAARLFAMGQEPRAERSLVYCFNLLGLPREAPKAKRPAIDPEQLAAHAAQKKLEKAQREFEKALALEPDLENGLEIYRECAACHGPEAWGMSNAVVPQLAGQHRRVLIKQLADIRAGHRENRVMRPYSSVERIGGAQAIADVTGYIDTLEISIENGKGSGKALDLGQRLYQENCVSCHDARGEGNDSNQIPRIQSQHYLYLVTQFELIRDGKRKISAPEMHQIVMGLSESETSALMDYLSRLEPPEALRAPPGWRNPDFAPPLAAN